MNKRTEEMYEEDKEALANRERTPLHPDAPRAGKPAWSSV